MVLVWWGVTILTFVIAYLIPSDPVALRLGPKATPASIALWRHKLGLDQSLPQQYVRYMTGLLHGDLGDSIWSGRPVLKDLADYLPATLELSISALLIAGLLGIPLGVMASNRPGGMLDRGIQLFATFGLAVPLFWLGLVIQLLFYRQLSILPFDSRIDLVLGPPKHITGLYILDSLLLLDYPRLTNSVQHLILPAITLSLPALGALARMTRASTLETQTKDYVRTAWAKGASRMRVQTYHVLRNSLLPVLTLSGNIINSLMAGAFVIEVIFNWPGIGWYATKAILASDYSAVVSITLIIAITSTIMNLLVDIFYRVLDPRILLS